MLLPVLLLQLRVLDSQLEVGQLGHERLVTHMERVRDRELERDRKRGNDRGDVRDVGKEKRSAQKVKRASDREGLMEKKRGCRE